MANESKNNEATGIDKINELNLGRQNRKGESVLPN